LSLVSSARISVFLTTHQAPARSSSSGSSHCRPSSPPATWCGDQAQPLREGFSRRWRLLFPALTGHWSLSWGTSPRKEFRLTIIRCPPRGHRSTCR